MPGKRATGARCCRDRRRRWEWTTGGGGNGSEGNGRLRPGTNPRVAGGGEAGHDNGAQGRGPGLGHWTAHGKGGSGGGGGGGEEEINEDECPPLL